jgi:hypothetical protein
LRGACSIVDLGEIDLVRNRVVEGPVFVVAADRVVKIADLVAIAILLPRQRVQRAGALAIRAEVEVECGRGVRTNAPVLKLHAISIPGKLGRRNA